MLSTIQQSIYEILNSDAWKSEVGLKMYPANYQGSILGDEHVRFHIIGPTGAQGDHSGNKRYTGTLILSFLIPAGNGDYRGYELGSKAAQLIDYKAYGSGLSFGVGSITNYGLDSVNKSLWRVDYLNNFLFMEIK